MKIAALAFMTITGAGLLGIAGHLRAQAGTPASVAPTQPDSRALAIGQPLSAPLLSQASALAVARGSDWGALLARGTNMTVKFGSYRVPAGGLARSAGETLAPRNVWAVTVGGMTFPSSVPELPPGYGPQPVGGLAHFLTVFVDDKTGKVVMAQENN